MGAATNGERRRGVGKNGGDKTRSLKNYILLFFFNERRKKMGEKRTFRRRCVLSLFLTTAQNVAEG